MLANLAADAVVLAHLGFILFVVFGGLAVLRWPRLAWFHVPSVIWAVLIEIFGWVCPLTPLENSLRVLGGSASYAGGFVDRYIVPLIYPPGLTRVHQLILAGLVVVINGAVYTLVVRQLGRSRGIE